jgi:hypothetical protein
MPRRSIDKKDQRSQVVRFELGNFERQQLEKVAIGNVAGNLALPIGIGLAGAAIGFGIFLAYKSLDELKDWAQDQWDNPLGMNTDNQERLQDSVTNDPIEANSRNTVNMPPVLEGLSAYAAYDLTWNEWDAIYGREYIAWCNENNLPQDHSSSTYFRENCSGFLRRTGYKVDNTVEPNEIYSQFSYQLAIRETAMMRQHARKASTLTGPLGPFLGGGFFDFFASSGAFNASSWTSADVTEAQGYIYDPLLDIAWSRSVIDGNEANKPITEVDRNLESWILSASASTDNWTQFWPPNSP